jgi:hypothetical protein
VLLIVPNFHLCQGYILLDVQQRLVSDHYSSLFIVCPTYVSTLACTLCPPPHVVAVKLTGKDGLYDKHDPLRTNGLGYTTMIVVLMLAVIILGYAMFFADKEASPPPAPRARGLSLAYT